MNENTLECANNWKQIDRRMQGKETYLLYVFLLVGNSSVKKFALLYEVN